MKLYLFRTVRLSIIRSLFTVHSAPDDGQTNCPKHVEFHDKVNLWN